MTSFWKPAKGTALLERREKRAAIKAHEQTEKAKVVKRDGSKVCRLVPNCEEREKFETCHLEDKGMGGDHGNRTDASIMLRGCFFHHQGVWSLHLGDLRVEYLTPEKANGPIEGGAVIQMGVGISSSAKCAVGKWSGTDGYETRT